MAGPVTIESPISGSFLDATQQFSVDVSDTNDCNNAVSGLFIPDNTDMDYLPSNTQETTMASPYQWTLTFDGVAGIPDGTALYVYAYDTVTGDTDQATYYQQAGGAQPVQPTKARSATVQVPAGIPSTGVQDIPVTVQHPKNTKGFVILILQKKGVPRPSVQIGRLTSATETKKTFAKIKMDDWDHVWVNVVVKDERGYEPHRVK
jgi:hypothetical protein